MVLPRVSNGTGWCKFLGQRDRSSFIVRGQRDNGTMGQAQNLAKGWDGPGQLKFRTGQAGTGQDSQNPGQDKGQNGTEQKRTF